jgi:hypothetical protein
MCSDIFEICLEILCAKCNFHIEKMPVWCVVYQRNQGIKLRCFDVGIHRPTCAFCLFGKCECKLLKSDKPLDIAIKGLM